MKMEGLQDGSTSRKWERGKGRERGELIKVNLCM
jgi:hypothetical protein